MVYIKLEIYVENFRNLWIGNCCILNDDPKCRCEYQNFTFHFKESKDGILSRKYYFSPSCDEHCRFNCDVQVHFLGADGKPVKYIKDVVYLKLSQTVKELNVVSSPSETNKTKKTYENYVELLCGEFEDFNVYPLDENGNVVESNDAVTLGQITDSKYELCLRWQICDKDSTYKRGMKRKEIANE
jgi:hypothetical protein